MEEKLSKLEKLKLKIDVKTLKRKIDILKYKGQDTIEEKFMILDLEGDLELSKYLLKKGKDKSKKKDVKNIGFNKLK